MCARQGVNIMAFCKEYNAATQDKVGTIIPVEITVYEVPPCCPPFLVPPPAVTVWSGGTAVPHAHLLPALCCPHAAPLYLQKWLPRRRAADATASDIRRTGASHSS